MECFALLYFAWIMVLLSIVAFAFRIPLMVRPLKMRWDRAMTSAWNPFAAKEDAVLVWCVFCHMPKKSEKLKRHQL